MVSCKHCSTLNSLDSTFCKRCGTALPEEEIQTGKEKLEVLIAEGNTSFNEGKTDEAKAIAENAITSNPTSIAALSLMAMCHERRGDLAEALECAERIVEINPDSELDKIKRNQLRNKLAISAQLSTQEPDRRVALIGAISTFVLVVCIGIGAAKFANRGETPKSFQPVVKNDTPVQQQPIQSPQVNPQNVTPPIQRNPVIQQPEPSRGGNEPLGGTLFVDGGGTLPNTGNGNDVVTIPPIPNGPIGSKPDPNSGGKVVVPTPSGPGPTRIASNTEDPNPGAVPGKDDGQEAGPGKIEIKLSDGTRRSVSGGSESVSPGGVSALVRVGMQRYQLGQFSAAAGSFEQAIRGGGDQMALNQRLGQCYENMGRKSDAAEAYKRGIAACQAALSNGSGNKESIQRRLDSCQQALKVLQGN